MLSRLLVERDVWLVTDRAVACHWAFRLVKKTSRLVNGAASVTDTVRKNGAVVHGDLQARG